MFDSLKPYLIRAIYEWCLANNQIPHITVRGENEIPRQHIHDGHFTMDISPSAVINLRLGDELIEFNARFNGVDWPVSFHTSQVASIYAKDMPVAGFVFATALDQIQYAEVVELKSVSYEAPRPDPKKKPKLYLVKNDD